MTLLPDRATLLVIDVQVGIDDPRNGARSNLGAEANLARLLAHWRESEWPVVHVQHLSTRADSPLRPDSPGCELKPEVKPIAGETLFQKKVNDPFLGTELESHLRRQGVTALVVMGFTADHCVSSAVRSASNLGFEVFLVDDATAAFERTGHDGTHHPASAVHAISVATLNEEFATALSTADLIG